MTRGSVVPPAPLAPGVLLTRRSPSRAALVDLADHREDLTAADHAEQLAVRDHLDRLVGGEPRADGVEKHGVGRHLWTIERVIGALLAHDPLQRQHPRARYVADELANVVVGLCT